MTEPVIKSPEEAREFLNQLKLIVQYTGISDLELEGAVRVDANISLKGHPRSEVKNINSFKEVESALKYEIIRQKNLIKRGKELIQETRHWSGRDTIGLRTKEFEKDYRYFPEQDLVPIELSKEFIQKVKEELPEMPRERAARLMQEYQLSEFDSDNLVLDKKIADFYEEGVKIDPSFGSEEYKLFCNWVMNVISGWLNDNNKKINQTKLDPRELVNLINSIKEEKITNAIGKTFIEDMMKGITVAELIDKKGIQVISEEDKLVDICKKVIEENPKTVEDCRKNPNALNALIGPVMKKTKGQAKAELTKEILRRLLNELGIAL